MQTFLPYPDFTASARALDRQRLGKQRVEVLQLMNAINGLSAGWWRNHPAAKMWRGHLCYLATYGSAVCDEWIRRGYRDSLHPHFLHVMQTHTGTPPAWLGDPEFHRSHQSNLIRKLPKHYQPLFPGVPADLPYVWPVG